MSRKLPYLLLVILLALSVAVLVGCGDDGEPQAVTDTTEGGLMDTETTEGMGTDTTEGMGTEDTEASGEVSGEEVFSQNCATCHGADGTGIDGPDLTALSLDQAAVEETVRTGPGAMTAFEGQLSDEQIQAVADYVTSEFMQ